MSDETTSLLVDGLLVDGLNGEGLGGHHVTLMRQSKGEPLPDDERRPGDLVMIPRQDPRRVAGPRWAPCRWGR